jgi:predicted xylose isomerase-like sugar epimerase
MHGIRTRDHTSLSSVDPQKLDPVVRLLDEGFRGVLTFEVFSEADFQDSLEAFGNSVQRVRARDGNKEPGECSPG